jgi:hypothetical protein
MIGCTFKRDEAVTPFRKNWGDTPSPNSLKNNLKPIFE